MIQIRRRWPILASLIGMVAYTANHYRIAGVEHLRLEPRPAAEIPLLENSPAQPGNWVEQSGSWMDQMGLDVGPVYGVNSSPMMASRGFGEPNLPEWKDKLSVGEKLALLEQQAEANHVSLMDNSSALPSSAPIPLPSGYQSSGLTKFISKNPVQLQNSGHPQIDAPAARIGKLRTNQPATSLGFAPGVANTEQRSLIAQPPTNQPSAFASEAPATEANRQAADTRVGQTIRVASFNVNSLGPAKLSKPKVVERLVGVLRQFDITALQEIRSTRDDILPMIVDGLNKSGRRFDYLIGPRVGRSAPHDQFAIVFDTEKLETDRYQLYTVQDPEDLITYEPLVAWFRCKGVPKDEAFTFSLVSFRIDASRAQEERMLIPSLTTAIENDGREEDDWIFAGDMADGLGSLTAMNWIRFAIRDMPTDVEGTRLLDSIFFSAQATGEFTGRSGAYDFLRKANLSLEGALEISDHLPVWAEFSQIEGADPGRVAPISPSMY